MTESVGFGDAPVPRRDPDPSPHPSGGAHDPAAPRPRVSVHYTLRGGPDRIAGRPAREPARPGSRRWRALAAWTLLGVGAALSGVVGVLMLGEWSEILVAQATASDESLAGVVAVGHGHGLFLLAASFLVLVAAMTKIWTFGALVGGHRATAPPLIAIIALDVAVVAVSALGRGVGLAGCVAVVVLDVGVMALLGVRPSRRR